MEENEYKKFLESFYEENFEKVYNFFFYKTFDQTKAEDLTSEAFLTFAQVLSSDKKEIDDHTKFFFGICKNIFVKSLKRKYEEFSMENSELEKNFQKYVEDENEKYMANPKYRDKVVEVIDSLPKKQRRVISLRIVENQSLQNIADILKKDMNYVKTTQRRAIKKIKKMLKIS